MLAALEDQRLEKAENVARFHALAATDGALAGAPVLLRMLMEDAADLAGGAPDASPGPTSASRVGLMPG